MAILLTNDDGIDAPGLAALVQALAGLDTLVVSAPQENRSGVGGGITIFRNLQARRHDDGPAGEQRWSIDGTPADAAKFGLQHVCAAQPPRLLVSGINLGPNIGVNVRSSGTIGAAFEGVTAGVASLAVSVDYVIPTNWEGVKHYARLVAELLLGLPAGGTPFLLNLNVPAKNPRDIKGLVIARHGCGGVRDTIVAKEEGGVFHLEADWISVDPGADCDASAFAAGYAVLTPLRLEMTDEQSLSFLAQHWRDKATLFREGN